MWLFMLAPFRFLPKMTFERAKLIMVFINWPVISQFFAEMSCSSKAKKKKKNIYILLYITFLGCSFACLFRGCLTCSSDSKYSLLPHSYNHTSFNVKSLLLDLYCQIFPVVLFSQLINTFRILALFLYAIVPYKIM